VWWELIEKPRCMAARVPQMVALQGDQLMRDPLEGPYHLMLATLWAVDLVDVLVGKTLHHGHHWRLPLSTWSAFYDLTTELLCSADLSVRPLLEAGLELLRIIEERAKASWLQ